MKNWQTTVTGIVLGIVTIVAGIGLIDAEQSATIVQVVSTVCAAIASLILVFKAKD